MRGFRVDVGGLSASEARRLFKFVFINKGFLGLLELVFGWLQATQKPTLTNQLLTQISISGFLFLIPDKTLDFVPEMNILGERLLGRFCFKK